jgi:ABC-type proline/glycine betaine transport system ATPase subunit
MTEALLLADRLGVMREGRLVQVGSPADLLRAPADAGVAALGELDGRIPVERMRASNLAVDGRGRSPSIVAQDPLSALRRQRADPAPAR